MEIIEIFFDTNILRNKNHQDYSKFEFGSEYSNFIDFINSKDLIETCHINVAEIVIEELKNNLLMILKKIMKSLES